MPTKDLKNLVFLRKAIGKNYGVASRHAGTVVVNNIFETAPDYPSQNIEAFDLLEPLRVKWCFAWSTWPPVPKIAHCVLLAFPVDSAFSAAFAVHSPFSGPTRHRLEKPNSPPTLEMSHHQPPYLQNRAEAASERRKHLTFLRRAIKDQFGSKSRHASHTIASDGYYGASSRSYIMDVFELGEWPVVKRCYAWSYREELEKLAMCVLDTPPVHSPRDAYRVGLSFMIR